LVEDREGFLYPKVDKKSCIECNICEKVCPIINQSEAKAPLAIYAAKNNDDKIRLRSSSGGVFSMLAEVVLNEGGVVFGVCWDEDWRLVFDYTESIDGLSRFRGSKYLQVHVGDVYLKVEQFLKSGRRVLFSGTPCQIRGLKLFLRRDYDKLLCVDIICHGVPSPGVFRRYLNEEIANVAKTKAIDIDSLCIDDIQFRDKRTGWKSYSFRYQLRDNNANLYSNISLYTDNIYMRGFLRDLYLRPSCYACSAKAGKSGADITLGDFWGIEQLRPEIDDDKGVSAVLLNTSLGELAFAQLMVEKYEMSYDDVKLHNSAIEKSVARPQKRDKFFRSRKSFSATIESLSKITLKEKYIFIIKNLFRRICG
jgi:coenzyme F420-reducing hydrogenase beta subunit